MAQVRDFLQAPGGEWDTTGGDFGTVADAAAVPQGIAIRLNLILEEDWLDETKGVDWLSLLGKVDPLVVRATLATVIGTTPDVTNVVGSDLVTDDASREATVNYNVDTVYSTNTLAGAVGVTVASPGSGS